VGSFGSALPIWSGERSQPTRRVRRQVIDWDQRARLDAIGDPWTGLRAELGSLARGRRARRARLSVTRRRR
jgi:hypothetical protein